MKKIFRSFILLLVLIFTWPFFLYKTYGNKDYKLKGKTIIISNHYSTFDAFFIYLRFHKKKIRFLTIIDVKKNIISRFLTWLFDCLYIDYNSPNVSLFKNLIKILNEGGVVCVFPEGEINPTKFGVMTFQKSFMFLAEKTNATILPLFIYPELKFFKKSKVYIGDEITDKDYSKYVSRENAVNDIQLKIAQYAMNENYDIVKCQSGIKNNIKNNKQKK